jgi:hypothetical protein
VSPSRNDSLTERQRDERWTCLMITVSQRGLHDWRWPGGAPLTWPLVEAEGSREASLRVDRSGLPLDATYRLARLPIDRDTGDFDLVLELARLECLDSALSGRKSALLAMLNGSPTSREERRARTLTLYGRDVIEELHQRRFTTEDLEALWPWPGQEF